MSVKWKAHLALLGVALIYGANYSIAKLVLDDNALGPNGFIVLRVSAALVLFSIFHWIFIKEKVERKDLKALFICSIFGVCINQLIFFTGLKYTSPIHASLIMTLIPMVVLIVSVLLLQEVITINKILGIVFGAAGAIALVLMGKEVAYYPNYVLGDLLILINVTSFSLFLVLVKPLMKKYHPMTVMKIVFTFGWFLVLPFGLKDLTEADWQHFDWVIWASIFYVLVFTTFLTYLFNGYALSKVNPTVVSVYIYLQPFIATVIALILGKDILTMPKIGAGMLIFLGVFFISFPMKLFNKNSLNRFTKLLSRRG